MSEHQLAELHREDFKQALKEVDSYIDVTLEDLMKINHIAQKHAQLRRAEQLMVRDIMTRDVATVTPDTTLRDAARQLLELRISGLPVVDDRGSLAGIVTEADFLAAMGIPYHHPAHSLWQSLETMFKHPPKSNNIPVTVADIMVNQVITTGKDNTLHDAIDSMKRHHIKRLVVADEQHKVEGIVTRSNLVQVLLQQIL